MELDILLLRIERAAMVVFDNVKLLPGDTIIIPETGRKL